MMISGNVNQSVQLVDRMDIFESLPIAIEVIPNPELSKLLSALSSDTPWGDRQIAAKRLGYLQCPEALPGLLEALPSDPFWMVRCAIIQALEMLGDPRAIPTLREVKLGDSFQVVRSYAAKAIERLSQGEMCMLV